MPEDTINSSKKRVRVLIIILLAFTVWAGFTVFRQLVEIKEVHGELLELLEDEQEALAVKEGLENKVLLLQNPEYIAELARKYYFLSKPGEYIFIYPDN